MQTPATVFVLSDEWVASPLCVQNIMLSLAARAGMDLSSLADVNIDTQLLAMAHEELSALRTGAFLVVAFDSSSVLESDTYRQLTDRDAGLGFSPAIIYDPSTTVPTLHASVSAFLDEQRLDATYKQVREEFQSAASDVATSIASLVASREKLPK